MSSTSGAHISDGEEDGLSKWIPDPSREHAESTWRIFTLRLPDGGAPLIVLPPPRSGLLAVLWWAAVITFLVFVVRSTILDRIAAHGRKAAGMEPPEAARPSEARLWLWFLLVLILVAAILLATRIVPGT